MALINAKLMNEEVTVGLDEFNQMMNPIETAPSTSGIPIGRISLIRW